MVIDARDEPGTIAAMTATLPPTALQLRSLIRPDGTLELSLADVPVPQPGPDDCMVVNQQNPHALTRPAVAGNGSP